MAESAELKQMVLSLRVSELQVLLGYARRNKHGRKHELLTKALHMLKTGCSPAICMKVKELYCRRFPTNMTLPGPHHPAPGGLLSGGGAVLPAAYTQLAYEGHAGLPLSVLGPGKHELSSLPASGPHLGAAAAAATLHPVHLDVKLQKLPFYDLLEELIKPTSIASDSSQRCQETCFAFALTPQQVQLISSSMDNSGTRCDFSVQVQLRFCLSETSSPQEDHFPPSLCVKVNGKPCTLPGYLPPTKNGVEPKRPSRPINITSLVRLSPTAPNTILVSWMAESGRSYSMVVCLVQQQTSTVLLQRLRSKGIRNPDHSRALIKEKLTADPDCEISTTSLRVSLLCPLGKMRLLIPCRALTCSHLQCFDATLYIQMNERKPTWACPVCDKKAPYEHLIIDGLFVDILNTCVDCDDIQFNEDGNWAPLRSKKEVQEVTSAVCNGVKGSCRPAAAGERSMVSHSPSEDVHSRQVEVIDLTLDDSSSSEESDDPPPPPKRVCLSLSPTSPTPSSNGVLNLQHQVSPMIRTSTMQALDSSYIPPVPPLLPDYRQHYTPNDLSDLNFFSFLQGDNQHYNMLMAAAASASEDHELLLSRFLLFGSSPSQLYLDQSSVPSFSSVPLVANGSNSCSSNSSLVSSSSLRDSSTRDSTRDGTLKDSSLKDLSFRDSSVRDSSLRDRSFRDSSRESSTRDSSTRNSSARDSTLKDSSLRDSTRDSNLKDSSLRDRSFTSSTRDSSTRNSSLRDSTRDSLRDNSLRDSSLRDSSLRNSTRESTKDRTREDSTRDSTRESTRDSSLSHSGLRDSSSSTHLHTHTGVLDRTSSEVMAPAFYSIMPDVISLD